MIGAYNQPINIETNLKMWNYFYKIKIQDISMTEVEDKVSSVKPTSSSGHRE